ncbi:MAG: S8/S53 family peptidase [Candidatus Eremiobacteraeota bacterium]|nr:S8/S53 family peptidase [Candidatus Eremiobacteraeota bacterium]
MNKSLLYAGLAVGILTASCSGNNTALPSLPLSAQSGIFNQPSGAAERAPQGWAATATHAVPIKNFPAGRVANSTQLHVVVGLRMRDRAGAQELIRNQYAPGSAAFHGWLSPDQFTAMFNPSAGEAASVATYLKEQGFTRVSVEPNHLLVSGYASAARAEAAFHTTIHGTVVNGKAVYGNVEPAFVPDKLRKVVLGVLGLTNAYEMHTHIKKSDRSFVPLVGGTPPPCLQVVNGICIGGEYGPPQYQVAYDAVNCPKTCSTGKRTSIAVMAEGDVSQVVSDLHTAEAFWGLPQASYSVVRVGTPSQDTSGLDEWDLDTQISSGFAQMVKHLYVYDTTSLSDSDTSLEFNKWVTQHKAQAGNASFGEPEAFAYADGAMQIDDEIFNQAAGQGQTMFASTGDSGSGCPVLLNTGGPVGGTPQVCYPASSPYVVAVGGTTLDTNAVGTQPGTYYGEHVWVGTGGGYSALESAGYWQANGICATCTQNSIRGTADIAMCADNNGCPMDVFINGTQTGVGGTSLSSPMSMGLWARLQTNFGNKLGFAAPVYYGVYGYYEPCPLKSTACVPSGEPGDDTSATPPDTTAPIGGFHDILYGSNGIPSSAGPGYDEPTGLGSIDYYVMQQDIQNSIFPG